FYPGGQRPQDQGALRRHEIARCKCADTRCEGAFERISVMVFRAVLCLFFLVFLAQCSSKKGEQSGEPDYQTRIKIKQYVSAGRQLYSAHCANCHQENGEGFAALYPPLKGVGYFKHNISQAICVMKYGMEGEIEVG